jgi:hypothetical protein
MKYIKEVSLVAIAFLIGVTVTAFLKWPPNQSSDWAAWVQAVGSIGAIIGAVAIAMRETWNRRKDETLRARFAAASMQMCIKQAYDRLVEADAWLKDHPDCDGEHSLMRLHHLQMTHAQLNVDDLIPLLPLPNRCAHYLARGRDAMGFAGQALSVLVINVDPVGGDHRRRLIGDVATNIPLAKDYIGRGLKEVQFAAHFVE